MSASKNRGLIGSFVRAVDELIGTKFEDEDDEPSPKSPPVKQERSIHKCPQDEARWQNVMDE